MQGVKLARELFATKAFSEWAGEELLPRHDVSNSDDDLNAFVTRTADSYYHLAGSCRMSSPSSTRSCACTGSRASVSPTRA